MQPGNGKRLDFRRPYGDAASPPLAAYHYAMSGGWYRAIPYDRDNSQTFSLFPGRHMLVFTSGETLTSQPNVSTRMSHIFGTAKAERLVEGWPARGDMASLGHK